MFVSHWPSHVRPPLPPRFAFNQHFQPTVSVREVDAGWELLADIPGCAVEDVKIALEGDTLTITAERKEPAREGQPLRRERPQWRLHESFRLLRPVDVEKVEATAKDGVLTIKLPRLAAPEPRTIPVSVA